MCTTFLISKLIEEFEEFDVIGFPRLVRLNPMIPWKTRGNGAVCIRFGYGYGRKKLFGVIKNKKIFSFSAGEKVEINHIIEQRVKKIVESYSRFETENTNPAYVISDCKPSQRFYWLAVREIVELEDAVKQLENVGAIYKGYKNQRGLVGATAAIAWRPHDYTFEVLAYRYETNWGKKREIDVQSVIEMDRLCRSTFNNYDFQNKRVCIAPHTNCPVLFGVRGDSFSEVRNSLSFIKCEPIERWLVFQTNQATDDHLKKCSIGEVKPYTSVITTGVVSEMPKTIQGGHVIVRLSNGNASIDCAAYEPTKQFRDVVRKLMVGDEITVYGGVRNQPLTINLEKLSVNKLVSKMIKVSNPICNKCGKSMKSIGFEKGYRCKKCGTKKPFSDGKFVNLNRALREGCFYDVPVCAKRHISKPLKRLKLEFCTKTE